MTPEQLKLADCPFCGGHARLYQRQNAAALWHAACENCDAGPHSDLGKPEAIARWNTRATPDARVKEALTKIEKDLGIYAQGLPEGDDLRAVLELTASDAKKALAALSHQPGTGEAGGVPDRETFWLVERIGHQQYVKDHSELPALTNDPWRAVRFVTEREAHDFWLRLATLRDECKPVEHMFINKGAPSPALDTAAVEAWQPMSLAPADQFVVLYCPEDKSYWFAKRRGNIWYGVDDCGLTREGAAVGDPHIVTGWFVSHWMPLPTPPRALAAKEGA